MANAVLEPTIAGKPHGTKRTADKWWEKAVTPSDAKRLESQKKILQTINFNVGSFDDKARTFRAIASTPCVDRGGDVIDQAGWDLTNFKNNPVIPWAHDYSELPVARAIEIGVVDGVLEFTYQAPPKGMNEFADMVYDYYRNQFMFAFSVGFAPKAIDGDEYSWDGNIFTECELLEISAVVVPANPQALALSYKNGMVDAKHAKQLIAKMQAAMKSLQEVMKADEVADDTKVEETKTEETEKQENAEEVTETNEEPKTSTAIDGEELAKTVSEAVKLALEGSMGEIMDRLDNLESKGTLSSNLPIADKNVTWDSGKAIKNIKKWASNDDGDIDFTKYKKCFMWCEDGGGDKQGDYKLPFADIIDGSPKAVWNAVKAMMAILNGGRGGIDIPDSDREKVYAQVKKYYKKFGEDVPELSKGLTDMKTKSDTESMADKTKDLGEGAGGGSALTPRQMAKVKEVHDYLKDAMETLGVHADALDGHAKTMAAHAKMVYAMKSALGPHVVTLGDLLDHNGDELSGDPEEDEKDDSVSGKPDKSDPDGDGIPDSSHMGDDAHGNELEDSNHPDGNLTRLSAKPSETKSKAKGEVKSDAKQTDGADHKDKEDKVEEGKKKSVEDKTTEKSLTDETEVDPENLTDEQIKEITRRVNERLKNNQ